MSVRSWSLQSMKLEFGIENKWEAGLKLKIGVGQTFGPKELWKRFLGTKVIVVYGFPIIYTPYMKVEAGLDFNIYFYYQCQASVTAKGRFGIQYNAGR